MQTLGQSRVEAFAGQIATEIGAALNAALVTMGDHRRSPATGSRTTSIPSDGCTTASPRSSARPGRCRNPAAAPSAPRPARPACGEVMLEGGFGSVRRAAETPLNLVLEARG
jgi:hypothetical protein